MGERGTLRYLTQGMSYSSLGFKKIKMRGGIFGWIAMGFSGREEN